jgi:hypothetical protein
VTNWAAYDASLRQRGSLTVWFSDDAVAAWRAAPRTTRGAQPWYSPLAILTALALRAVFRLALRRTEGLIGSIIGLLGLALAVPDHSTLSRRARTLEVPRRRSDSGGDGEPLHLLVDSTGLKLFGAGEWLLEKHGTKTRRSWRKLHIGMDADTGEIIVAELTTNDVDDASRVSSLLNQVAGPVASLTGDGAYDQDGFYRVVIERDPDAAVIVPPRGTAVLSETAETEPTQRDRHLQCIAEKGRMGWQKASGYNKRSRVGVAATDTSNHATQSRAQVGVLDHRGLSQPGVAQSSAEPLVLAGGCFAVDQQAEPVLARQIVGRRLVAHVEERVGHCGQTEVAQALRHGVDQHRFSFRW